MLIPAIGFRKNHKEYVPVKKLDETLTGCFSCPYYGTKGACASCEKRQYYTESAVRYVNEQHRHGYKKPLKKNAILLYMYLHFLPMDGNGFVRKIDAEEAALAIHCDPKTVANNISLLHEAGYIIASKAGIPGCYQAFICEYKNMFRKANEGGRGFLRIGKDLMEKVLLLPDTNTIRLAIRSYIESMDQKKQGEKSLNEIKSVLPEYVTKKKLHETIGLPIFRSIFHVQENRKSASIMILPQFNQLKLSEKIRSKCRESVEDLLIRINKAQDKTHHSPIHLSKREIDDISNISLKFPIDAILSGTQYFYENYIVPNRNYSNAGALIRTFASDISEYGFVQ